MPSGYFKTSMRILVQEVNEFRFKDDRHVVS